MPHVETDAETVQRTNPNHSPSPAPLPVPPPAAMSQGTSTSPRAVMPGVLSPHRDTSASDDASQVRGGRSADEADAAGPPLLGRVCVDGKFFSCAGERFVLRGVSYGTFSPRACDGAQFPEPEVVVRDLAEMAARGFTVVRTYTAPPDDLLDTAKRLGLRVLAGIHYSDWRYIVGASNKQRAAMVRSAASVMREEARRLAGHDEVLAVVIGNEVPADAVRWFGAKHIARALSSFARIIHAADANLLVTYANYPTTEYLDVSGVDFLTFNLFLEDRVALRRYLTRLHHLAGDRPLVVGEIGLHAGDDDAGEQCQAEVLGWQLETTVERGAAGTCVFSWTDEWWVGGEAVEGWRFGLTRQDRSPRPALDVASAWNLRTVADLDHPWPAVTVAICAYNAAETLGECLRETTRLTYPKLQIIVVDDGSTDATAEITRLYPQVELMSVAHAGLSAARNTCIQQACGDLIAFLDADAYPSPEWPYYLALAMDGPRVGGVGGPNVPPRDDPAGAHRVAAAPGGPVHVLTSDDRAEHIPGCNMAFWKPVLAEVGGFDPVYTSAGDDVDVCWKVLDRGWEIGFHPAALVWHHRRASLAAYVRQQRGYGKAESLVAARHPDRYTSAGTARWRGRIYTSTARSVRQPRIYRGVFGSAAFQSVYRGGGDFLDIIHQAGVPLAAALLLPGLAAGVVWAPAFAIAALAVMFVVVLGTYDAISADPPTVAGTAPRSFRAGVGLLHILQPLARWWGRWRHRVSAHRDLAATGGPLIAPVDSSGWTILIESHEPRSALVTAIIGRLRKGGVIVQPVTGWEDHDGRISGSLMIAGELLSSAHVSGVVQVRVRRLTRWTLVAAALVIAGLLVLAPVAAAAIALALTMTDVCVGAYRIGPRIRRILRATNI